MTSTNRQSASAVRMQGMVAYEPEARETRRIVSTGARHDDGGLHRAHPPTLSVVMFQPGSAAPRIVGAISKVLQPD